MQTRAAQEMTVKDGGLVNTVPPPAPGKLIARLKVARVLVLLVDVLELLVVDVLEVVLELLEVEDVVDVPLSSQPRSRKMPRVIGPGSWIDSPVWIAGVIREFGFPAG